MEETCDRETGCGGITCKDCDSLNDKRPVHIVSPINTKLTVCSIKWDTNKHRITGDPSEVTCNDCLEGMKILTEGHQWWNQ